ncbi:MAG: PIG-L deacetylase family protein [Planctomycetota bacterium]
MTRSMAPSLYLRICALATFAVGLHASVAFAADKEKADDGKLRIIAFGAHPDDCEFKVGGTAAKWAEQGHHVKLVSVTNGDIGHWQMAGGPLAQRRTAEVKEAAKRLGVTAEVLDIHDGELLPTLENRQKITRLIRDWKADLVLSHRPNDYHPDHRYVGVLVQDAAYMVAVPYFCPDTPPLQSNPVFLYYSDNFQKPNPFTPDIAVSIDDVIEKKIHAVDALASQVYEGGAMGSEAMMRDRHADDPVKRLEWLAKQQRSRYGRVADDYRDALIRCYGPEKGRAVQCAEAFEICEYGRRPNEAEIRKLFPFLSAK